MSKLMQLPDLYIRGSIGTQTMANLTAEQIAETDRIVRMLKDDPCLAPDRYKFIQQLGATIRADYYSDPTVAEQEFIIAIWRATVHLLYHCDYRYICTLCGDTEYTTVNGKTKAFDRQYKICPKCDSTHYCHEGTEMVVKIVRKNNKYYITGSDDSVVVSKGFRHKSTIEDMVSTPIRTILGARKIEDPYAIINDDVQRNKWYSTWIWNYFRQILNENVIRTHNKQSVETSGPANIIAFQLIINELNRNKYKYYYDESTIKNIDTSELEVFVAVDATDPEFSISFLNPLIYEYSNYGVDIIPDHHSIKVVAHGDVPFVNATITTEDTVIVLSTEQSDNNNSNDEDMNWRDAIEFNSVDINGDGDIDRVVARDVMGTIRKDLPETSRMVFDILSQTGDTWAKFSNEWGDKQACKSHIAKFLKISPNTVEEIKRDIGIRCIAYGLSYSQ